MNVKKIEKFMRDLQCLRSNFSTNYTFKRSKKFKLFMEEEILFEDAQVEEIVPHQLKGHPEKSFNESGPSSKRKKSSLVASSNSPFRLIDAGQKLSKQINGIDSKKIIDFMIGRDLSTDEIINIVKKRQDIKVNSPQECLKLYLEMGLTQRSYQTLRNNSIKNNFSEMYCSYRKLQEQMAKCVPISLECSDDHFKIDPHDLMQQTITRIIHHEMTKDCSLDMHFDPIEINKLFHESKIGVDGAQNGSNYALHFSDKAKTDSDFVLVTMVPLSLKYLESIIWQNRKPNSISFTRPVFFVYDKESPELIKEILHFVNSSLDVNDVFTIQLNSTEFKFRINSQIKWTMIDGKVVNFATNNKATLRCNVCTKTFKDFKNEPPSIQPINEEILDFGISPLHSKLKIFEYLLNLGRKNHIENYKNNSSLNLNPSKVKETESNSIKIM